MEHSSDFQEEPEKVTEHSLSFEVSVKMGPFLILPGF